MRLLATGLACLLFAGCAPSWERGSELGRSAQTPAAELEQLAESEQVLVRAAVAGNPRTPEPTLWKLATTEKLAPNGSTLVGNALGANSASSERVLLQVLSLIRPSPSRGDYVKGILENPSVTPAVIDALARDKEFWSYADPGVASHSKTSAATLEYIVRERPRHYSGSFAQIAANPNANAATLVILASLVTAKNAAAFDALLAREDLPFEALRRLTWTTFTPWMRERLYAHPDFAAQRESFEAMKQPEARRVLLERHGTQPSLRERVRSASEGLTLQDSIVRHAAALRALAVRLEAEHAGLEIDFFQSINRRAHYVPERGAKCAGFEGFQEMLRVSVRRGAGAQPRELGILADSLPPATYCFPRTSASSGPLYVGVRVDRLEKELRAVLLRDAPADVFVSYLGPAYTAESDTFLRWEDLRDRFGWKSSGGSPRIEVLDGPGRGGLDTRSGQWIIVGRLFVDNVIVDGSIREGTNGILLRRGTRILRRPGLPPNP